MGLHAAPGMPGRPPTPALYRGRSQGLPFALAGVGDLLALFRCVSCRYRFSTDTSKPELMGAIGRVFVGCEVRLRCSPAPRPPTPQNHAHTPRTRGLRSAQDCKPGAVQDPGGGGRGACHPLGHAPLASPAASNPDSPFRSPLPPASPASPPPQPEMTNNLQKYDKQVYLRVSEAQRCRVHSTLVMPVFACPNRQRAVAVCELVQSEKNMAFPQVRPGQGCRPAARPLTGARREGQGPGWRTGHGVHRHAQPRRRHAPPGGQTAQLPQPPPPPPPPHPAAWPQPGS
jgi:hypothetical protein